MNIVNADNWLIEKFEALFFNGTRNSRHPLHFLMPQRRIAVLVQMYLVATHVFGRVTGNVGGTHETRDIVIYSGHHYDAD